jgi:hypothetical protein
MANSAGIQVTGFLIDSLSQTIGIQWHNLSSTLWKVLENVRFANWVRSWSYLKKFSSKPWHARVKESQWLTSSLTQEQTERVPLPGWQTEPTHWHSIVSFVWELWHHTFAHGVLLKIWGVVGLATMPRIKKLATTATRKRANFMVCSDQLVVSTIKHEDGRGSTHQLRYWKFVGYLQECHSFDLLYINGFLIEILSLELSPSSSPSKKIYGSHVS